MKRITEETKRDIRFDREYGLSLYQLVSKYEISKSTIAGIIKGCDDSKVLRASPSRRVVVKVETKERPDLSKTDLGEAARQMICARLMLNGVKVFRPMTEDTPIDLLVLRKNGEVLKCQCKYVFPDKRGCHILKCCSAGRGDERGKGKHIYTKDEVDFLLGYCLDNDAVYVVPITDTGGQPQLSVWVLRKPQGSNGLTSFSSERYRNSFQLLK